jgi:hypothetical protein
MRRRAGFAVVMYSIENLTEVIEFIGENSVLRLDARVIPRECCTPTTKRPYLLHMTWRSHLRLVEYTQLPELEVGSGSRRVIVTHLI